MALENFVKEAGNSPSLMNRVFDTRSESKYKEFAKHLIPGYTLHRASEMGWMVMEGLALSLEIAKTFSYAKVIVDVAESVSGYF